MTEKILLVSPSRNYHMANEMYPSGALLLLGTLLKEQGYTVKVVHMVADRVDITGFCGILAEFRPDIVGFTVSTYQTKVTRSLLEKVKSFDNRIVTIAGGSHPSALGVEFLNAFPDTDIVVYGEGENALLDIVQGRPLSLIRGIHYKKGNARVTNDPAPMMTNLDNLPLPDKSLIDFSRYSGLFPVGSRPSMFIMSSRGCPFRCSFCSRSIYGNTLRLRSPENIMAEVELLYKDWGVKEIHFGDDTFNANRQWADKLLDLIIKGGYHKKLVFRVALRVNEKILDIELLKHLKATGVWFVYYGVENGNQSMLNHMRKGITIEEVKRAFALAHSVGIKTEAFFIIGLPGETPQTIKDSYDLYKEIKPYWAGYSRAMPFPGTEFTREVRDAGHLLCDDYDKFCPSNIVVITDAMAADELEAWVFRLNRRADIGKLTHPKQVMYAIKDRAFRR